MDLTENSCRDFVRVLSSSEPVPGGGGAAALVGAIGTALGGMVASLTLGKKKYADVEAEIRDLKAQCDDLQEQLLCQVEADAEGFAPLALAYGIARDNPEREAVLENATADACLVPLHIMALSARGLELVAVLAEKGSRLAVSDAGCAAVCLKAAMQAASLNVRINTAAMKNRERAQAMEAECRRMLQRYEPLADGIYQTVRDGFDR